MSRKELSVVVDAASLTRELRTGWSYWPCRRDGGSRAADAGRAKRFAERFEPGPSHAAAPRNPGWSDPGVVFGFAIAFVLAAEALSQAAEALHDEFLEARSGSLYRKQGYGDSDGSRAEPLVFGRRRKRLRELIEKRTAVSRYNKFTSGATCTPGISRSRSVDADPECPAIVDFARAVRTPPRARHG